MAEANAISVPEIKAARAENPKMRDRDLADKLGISEAWAWWPPMSAKR